MADVPMPSTEVETEAPQFIEEDALGVARPVIATPRSAPRVGTQAASMEKKKSFVATLDLPQQNQLIALSRKKKKRIKSKAKKMATTTPATATPTITTPIGLVISAEKLALAL